MNALIPPDFLFSQSNLQDFVDCPRLFDYRYLRRINYPAPQSEPLAEYEAHVERGSAFHTLIHQHLIGIDAATLTPTIDDADLMRWWENYLRTGLQHAPALHRYPEIALTAPLAGGRLIAKYDLVALDQERAVIMDWKTSLKRPKRQQLLARLQTILYRWMLVTAGHDLNGGAAIAPENITMIYWFAEHPDAPEILPYDAETFAADERALTRLIQDITSRGAGDFPLTDNLARCKFCQYRSLDERGTTAGDFTTLDDDEIFAPDDTLPEFTLDQIAEIEF